MKLYGEIESVSSSFYCFYGAKTASWKMDKFFKIHLLLKNGSKSCAMMRIPFIYYVVVFKPDGIKAVIREMGFLLQSH
jgi:hypothetical protein